MFTIPNLVKAHRRRAAWFTMLVCLAGLALVPGLRAFKVGFNGERSIHENITGNAILAVAPNADAVFANNVKSGVFNTDFSHQVEAPFHFDKSTTNPNTPGFGGFDAGLSTLHDMLAMARNEAQVCDSAGLSCAVNPLFLQPLHARFDDLINDLADTYKSLSTNTGCLEELACPSGDFGTDEASLIAESLPVFLENDLLGSDFPDPDQVTAHNLIGPISLQVPNFADNVAGIKTQLDALLGSHCRPRWAGGMCFETLELMAPGDPEFPSLAAHLRILQYEYQAYFAWQHLGHAFHTTQDFFAHSNYVELAAGRKGPQCDPNFSTLCDAPLDTNSGRWDAIRLPSDGAGWVPSLASFRSIFSAPSLQATLNGLPSIFGDNNNFSHLQTGWFPCASDIPGFGIASDHGFSYCHTATTPSPGLNKDKEYDPSGSELNHKNFDWAVTSAQRMSVVLFEAFISDLLGPATGGYVSINTADAASRRNGEMAWLSPHLNVTGALSSGLNLGNLKTGTSGIQLQQAPALAATVSSNAPSASPITDTVTVTSNGVPVAGATVSSGNSTYVTNASGVVVITHTACFAGTPVAKVGGTTVPARMPVPCNLQATASMTGYQSFSFSLP